MPRSDQKLIKHPHAISSWTTIKLQRLNLQSPMEMKTVLEVKTDLVLNADSPDYNKEAVDSLLKAVNVYLAGRAEVDAAEISQA